MAHPPPVYWDEDNLAEKVTFELGEQVEPLYLKVLIIGAILPGAYICLEPICLEPLCLEPFCWSAFL